MLNIPSLFLCHSTLTLKFHARIRLGSIGWNREKLISGLWLWPCGLQASVLRYIQPNLCGPFDIGLHVIICFLLFIQSCAFWFDFYLKMYSNFWHIHVCLGYGLYSALGGLANQSSPATLSFSFLSSPLGDIGAKLCGQSDHTLTLMLRCLYKTFLCSIFLFGGVSVSVYFVLVCIPAQVGPEV